MSTLGISDDTPAAARTRSPGWRDPRLWVGIAIIAASVLIGARVYASADDTVQVWALADDVEAGQTLDPGQLVSRRVHLSDDELALYLAVDEELPADLTLQRPVGAGELLPRGALGASPLAGTVDVSLPVDPLRVPGSLAPGSVVDVWLVPRLDDDARAGADDVLALDDVTVTDAPAPGESLAPTGERQVVVAVPEDEVAAFHARLARAGDAVLSVSVRR